MNECNGSVALCKMKRKQEKRKMLFEIKGAVRLKKRWTLINRQVVNHRTDIGSKENQNWSVESKPLTNIY